MAVNLKLCQGDKVALVAPASGQKTGQGELVNQAIALLQSWGLVVQITPDFSATQRYLSASDKIRADNLIKALKDSEIKAIFVTRGGYGCARLLPLLSSIEVPTPRFLIGFSDITTLHLQFAQTANVICVHAPNMATQQILGEDDNAKRNRQALRQLLFHSVTPALTCTSLFPQQKPVDWQSMPFVGGCLSLLVTSLGTPHEIDSKGKLLLIEEVGESPYKIDRMLTHLRNAGKFDHVSGVVFGDMVGCDTPSIAIDDVLSLYFADDDFPVYRSKNFGHGDINLPWIYAR